MLLRIRRCVYDPVGESNYVQEISNLLSQRISNDEENEVLEELEKLRQEQVIVSSQNNSTLISYRQLRWTNPLQFTTYPTPRRTPYP